jgi:hypothetical protein
MGELCLGFRCFVAKYCNWMPEISNWHHIPGADLYSA